MNFFNELDTDVSKSELLVGADGNLYAISHRVENIALCIYPVVGMCSLEYKGSTLTVMAGETFYSVDQPTRFSLQ